jgi:hypothetical protein
MSGHDVSIELRRAVRSDHQVGHTSLIIDPKAILRTRYPILLPETCLSPERVRDLAEISLRLCLLRALPMHFPL